MATDKEGKRVCYFGTCGSNKQVFFKGWGFSKKVSALKAENVKCGIRR